MNSGPEEILEFLEQLDPEELGLFEASAADSRQMMAEWDNHFRLTATSCSMGCRTWPGRPHARTTFLANREALAPRRRQP